MKFIYLVILLCFFSSHLVIAQTQNYEDKRIAKVEVVPENLPPGSRLDVKNIQSRLKTKTGDLFSLNAFDDDLKTLAMEFDHITPTIQVQNNEIFITIQVQPRPIIKQIVFKGNFQTKQRKLEKEFNIIPHSTFNHQEFNQAFHRLKEYYVKRGFFEAEIEYQIIPDKTFNEVTIELIINEGRSGKIGKIVFKGFSKQEKKALKSRLHTKSFFPLTSWYTGTGIYREEALEFDKLTVLHSLQNEGYADAKIEIVVDGSEKKDRINIIIAADQGEKYTFGDISFSGNDFANDETVQHLIQARKGQPYSPEELQESVKDLSDYFGKRGYVDASVSYQPHLEPTDPVYNVHFTIHEGNPYRVGLIKILGNDNTRNKVILHESLLVPGETFDTRKLEATQKRLENIGYFKCTNVYASSTTSTNAFDAPLKDVNIEVEESNTGNFGVSFGYSTQTKLFGGLEITERNFNSFGFTRVFQDGIRSLRGGGEYLRMKASVGKELTDYAFSWTKPYFLDSNWTIGFNVNDNISRLQARDYDIKTFSTSANAFYTINRFLSFEWHYRLRNLWMKVNGGAPLRMQEEANNDGIVSSTGVALLYDSTNNPYKASDGFISSLQVDFAGLGGHYTYFKFSYHNAYYQPLLSRFVAKTRADADFILPLGNTRAEGIPVGEREFIGGETTVRGYEPFSIGPRYDKDNPRGGISTMVLSQEIMYNILPNPGLDAFIFFDAGSNSLKQFHVNTYRASAGFGFRVEVIRGMPITFGWGFPINPEFHDDIHRNFFSMGGKF